MSPIDPILAAGRLLLARHAEAGAVPADALRVFLAELEAALRRGEPPRELRSLGELTNLHASPDHERNHR